MNIIDRNLVRIISLMSKEEKERLVITSNEALFSSMGREDKKQMIVRTLPTILDKMLEGLTVEDKKDIMKSFMPELMKQLSAVGGLQGLQ